MTARDGDDRLGSDGNNDARASSGADGRDGRDDMGGYIGRDGYVLGRAGYPMRTLDTGRHFRRPQPAAVGRDGSDGNNDARASSGADGIVRRDGNPIRKSHSEIPFGNPIVAAQAISRLARLPSPGQSSE